MAGRTETGGSGREEILSAATREFADHGYAGATTAGIARRAGLTQPLVHHHFGSKQGLWEAVLAVLFEDLERELRAAEARAEGMDRRARLVFLLRTLVAFSGRRPELARLIRTESSAGGESFEALYNRWLGAFVRWFEREVGDAIADGTARPVDARLAYFAIIGACTDAFTQPEVARRAFGLDLREPAAVDRYAELVVDLVTRGLLAPEAAAGDQRATPRRGKRR